MSHRRSWPAASLDQLFGIIESLVEQGVTIIYISHRLDEVFRIADEVTVLKDGELVDTRPIDQLDRPDAGRVDGRAPAR